MYKLKVISSTVRPGRKGPAIAKWITQAANDHGFDAEMIDLGELNLPLMNEPVHPALKQYEHEHTKQWSAKIAEADAFIFVTTEYNHSYPASLKNAVEYLVHEWAYKPAGMVGYSIGPFAGARAILSLKADMLALKNIALSEMVNIPQLNQFMDEDGNFIADERLNNNAKIMLDQLVRWAKGMKAIRDDK